MSNQELIEKFNEKFPVGAKVYWRSVAYDTYPHRIFEVRGAAFDMNGQAVAFLKGKAGCVSIEPQFLNYDRIPENMPVTETPAEISSTQTPREKFRNSVGFQSNFVQFSGLSIEEAIDNICKRFDSALAAETGKYKIALADAIRSPMGVCPDSARGLITDKDLREAEARRTNKPRLDAPCAECGKTVGNDYSEVGEGKDKFIVCGECECQAQEGWEMFKDEHRKGNI